MTATLSTATASPAGRERARAFTGPRGHGRIELACVAGRTRVVRCLAREPLKLLAPDAGGAAAAVYATTFGGGLVGGDEVHVDVDAGAGTTAFLGTQSATKVFRAAADGRGGRQSMRATVADGALLVVWPDPVICFAGADYWQGQQFELSAGAGLALVDWQTSGRRARGERWAFARYESRNRVAVDGRVVLNDALLLDAADGAIDATFRAGRFECLATVAVFGVEVDEMSEAARSRPVGRRAETLVSASRISAGALVRVLGRDAQAVGGVIRELLAGVTARLGDDPWARKW